MSNGIENVRSKNVMDDPNRMGGTSKESLPKEEPEHPLDSDENVNLLSKINNWYDHEWQIQAPNRYQMMLDCDYYDSMQWTQDEANILMERGQAPLVFNEIKPTIDWMIGTERRARIDYKILPRKNDKEAEIDAENKTQLLKYLSDVNKEPFHRSQVFESSVKAGVGWFEVGIKGDPTEELLYVRNEDWRNIIYDSNSVEMDGDDMRYQFRSRYLDTDIAVAYFPDRKEIIESSAIMGDQISSDENDEEVWYMGTRVTQAGKDYAPVGSNNYQPYSGSSYNFSNRERVRLKECWYKVPVLTRKFSGDGDLDNKVFDKDNEEHIAAIKGDYSLYDKLELQVRCAIYCKAGLLYDGKSPYKHGRLPFVPSWCYRRKRDNAPYGCIRALRDPQDDLNKRHSKAQHILATKGVIMDKGAVDNINTFREEFARPDYIIEKNIGKSIEVNRDVALAAQHVEMMQNDILHIRNAGGVNSENLGRESNVHSGIALQERKESGTVVTTAPFDNLRFAVQIVGEMELSNIEQFYTEQKTIRIIGERGGIKFQDLNKPDGNGNILNDITKNQADFVVSEQDYRSTLRQAMFESLFDIVGKLGAVNPQVALSLLDLVVDMADLPNKDELVARIRKINGQTDPDHEETPQEKQARMQQEAQAQAKQDELEALQLDKLKADVDMTRSQIDTNNSKSLVSKVDAIYSALQAAGTIATIPAAAPIADEILKGSGFVDAITEANQGAIQEASKQLQGNQQEMQNVQMQGNKTTFVQPQNNLPQPAQDNPAVPNMPDPTVNKQTPGTGERAGIETQRIEPL